MRVIFLDQQEERQDTEADNREDLERIEIGCGTHLRLHHKVDAAKSLMAP
jgi:hypothetical protein